jgi:hypothetical protein
LAVAVTDGKKTIGWAVSMQAGEKLRDAHNASLASLRQKFDKYDKDWEESYNSAMVENKSLRQERDKLSAQLYAVRCLAKGLECGQQELPEGSYGDSEAYRFVKSLRQELKELREKT